MRKFIYKSVLLIAVALMATGCSTDDIDTFAEQENAIRFPGVSAKDTYYSGYNSADGYFWGTYSFLENPNEEWMEYQLPVNIVGKVSDKEREVLVTIVEEESTAPKNSYEILGGSILANEREGFVRIRIANTPDLLTKTYQIKVILQKTDDFKLGPKAYLTAVLTWNNILPAPTVNNYRRSYNLIVKGHKTPTSTSADYYSTSAHLAIVRALGWNDWGNQEIHGSKFNKDGYNYLPHYNWVYQGDLYKAYAKILDEYLKAYEAEHGEPLLHDGGKLIGQPVEARI